MAVVDVTAEFRGRMLKHLAEKSEQRDRETADAINKIFTDNPDAGGFELEQLVMDYLESEVYDEQTRDEWMRAFYDALDGCGADIDDECADDK